MRLLRPEGRYSAKDHGRYQVVLPDGLTLSFAPDWGWFTQRLPAYPATSGYHLTAKGAADSAQPRAQTETQLG